MAFTAETGEGLDDANSYIDTAYFDEYHTDRGHSSAVALNLAVKKSCCIRASDYLDKRFGKKFRGTRLHNTQGLEWPRLDAWDNSDFMLVNIPTKLKQACAEYAFRAAIYSELAPDPLLPTPTMDTTGGSLPTPATEQGPGALAETTEKADVVEEQKRYFSPNQMKTALGGRQSPSELVSSGSIPEYPAADLLLEQLVRTGQRTLQRG